MENVQLREKKRWTKQINLNFHAHVTYFLPRTVAKDRT